MPLDRGDDIAALLAASPRIAMVGASADPARPSYGVMQVLLDQGFTVVPVNPLLAGQTIHGQTVLADLSELSPPADIVDVFRRSDAAGRVIDAAIAHGAQAVWLQLGVFDDAAVARAEAAGLQAVVDHCIKIEVLRHGIHHPATPGDDAA
jgi:uncharacterized protein